MGCVTTMNKHQLVKLVSSFSMADGGLYRKSDNGNAYFMMNMLAKHSDYIDWVQQTLENIVHVNRRDFINEKNSPNLMTNINTRTHPMLTTIHGRIYRDKYKSLDEHVVQHMDWEVLAIFYMADGCLSVERPNPRKGLINPSPNLSLNMKRLSYGDQWMLKKILKDKFDLEFNILKHNMNGKTYYYMRLRNKDIPKFMSGIAQYILPSFQYKLFNCSNEKLRNADDDIVCSVEQSTEEHRNDVPSI